MQQLFIQKKVFLINTFMLPSENKVITCKIPIVLTLETCALFRGDETLAQKGAAPVLGAFQTQIVYQLLIFLGHSKSAWCILSTTHLPALCRNKAHFAVIQPVRKQPTHVNFFVHVCKLKKNSLTFFPLMSNLGKLRERDQQPKSTVLSFRPNSKWLSSGGLRDSTVVARLTCVATEAQGTLNAF